MKKALSIAKTVLTWLLVVAAVGMMIFTIVSVTLFDKTDRNLFGYKAFIVLSDSMKGDIENPTGKGYFDAGDLVVSKVVVDTSTLKEGDIITFQSIDTEKFGEVITHKIRKVTQDENGLLAFATYGTTTGADDGTLVPHTHVMGKYQFSLAGVGKFFEFLKTTPGYIVCIFLPFLLLILTQAFNSIKLFRQYKAEQMAEIEAKRKEEMDQLAAEREKLEAERLKSEAMMAELMKMREAMMAQTAAPAPAAPAAAADTDIDAAMEAFLKEDSDTQV